jgi:hypothetical protein
LLGLEEKRSLETRTVMAVKESEKEGVVGNGGWAWLRVEEGGECGAHTVLVRVCA